MPNNPRRLTVGTLLDRFRVLKRLGRGATATVYLAEDTGTGQQVALKAMHADLHSTGSHAAARMKREIELVHRIDHPGVCRIYDLHAEDRLLFLTMQYIPGATLDIVLKTEGRLMVPRAARILRAVCRGLFAAHDLEILHRDLKPSNIMLAPRDHPFILDFGYATGPNVGRLTATGEWVGTLYYAAPELLKNEPNTKLSDIYSLGVILYQCLTGQLPFQGANAGEIADALLFRDPIPPRSLCADISRDLEAVVLKAMRRAPSERYTEVMELEHVLGPFDTAPRNWGVPEVLPLPGAEDSDPNAATPVVDDQQHRRPRPPHSWSDSQPSQPTHVLVNSLMTPTPGPSEALTPAPSAELTPAPREPLTPEPNEVLTPELAPGAPVAPQPPPEPRIPIPAPAGSPRPTLEADPGASATPSKRSRRVRYLPPQGGGLAAAQATRLPGRTASPLSRDKSTADNNPDAASLRTKTPSASKVAPSIVGKAKVGGQTDAAAKPVPADPVAARHLFDEQAKLLDKEKRERGLNAGDNLTLDSLERMSFMEMSRNRWLEAANYVRLALAEARGTAIDAAFVGAKIQRFDKLLRAVGGLQAISRFEAALDPVMKAFEKQDFRAANVALNAAFALLEE
jgi:serine/threonine protein kinase